MNDSLLTTVCVRYRPDEVAAAVVYLSYLYMGLPRVDAKLLDTDEAVIAGESRMRCRCLLRAWGTFYTVVAEFSCVSAIFRVACDASGKCDY